MSNYYEQIIGDFNKSNSIIKRNYACTMWNYFPGSYDPDVLGTQSWEDIVKQTANLISGKKSVQMHPDFQKIQVPMLIYHMVDHLGVIAPLFTWQRPFTEYVLESDGHYVSKMIDRLKSNADYIKAQNDFSVNKLNVYNYLNPVVHSFANISHPHPYAQNYFYNTEPYIAIWNPVTWMGEQIGPGWTIGAQNIVPGVVRIFVPYGESFASQIDEQLMCNTHTWAAIVKPVERLPDEFIKIAEDNNFPLKTPGCSFMDFSKYRKG